MACSMVSPVSTITASSIATSAARATSDKERSKGAAKAAALRKNFMLRAYAVPVGCNDKLQGALGLYACASLAMASLAISSLAVDGSGGVDAERPKSNYEVVESHMAGGGT